MEIKDASTMRALAHPLRMRLLELVATSGEITASGCSQVVDESPANCSFHLRTLEKAGFIERVEGKTGRDRPYRVVDITQSWASVQDDPETIAAVSALDEMLLDFEVGRMRAGVRNPPRDEWRGATYGNGATLWLTSDELTEIQRAYQALIAPYIDRWSDPASRPPEGRPVRLFAAANLITDLTPRGAGDQRTGDQGKGDQGTGDRGKGHQGKGDRR